MQRKCAVAEIEDVGSRDVSGHQVRGALDALEAETTNTSQRFNGERLGETRNAFHHGVTAADEDKQELVDDLSLTDDDFGKFGADLRR